MHLRHKISWPQQESFRYLTETKAETTPEPPRITRALLTPRTVGLALFQPTLEVFLFDKVIQIKQYILDFERP